jgi:HEPN domain-containing protein
MDDETSSETTAWLRKARRDLDSAQRLLQGDPPYLDTAVYHCQQAAEKALKACLTASGIPFPKTHDLTLLVELSADVNLEFAELREAAIILTPYATLFRYPDAVLEPTAPDAAEALAYAVQMLAVVEAALGSPPPSV